MAVQCNSVRLLAETYFELLCTINIIKSIFCMKQIVTINGRFCQ